MQPLILVTNDDGIVAPGIRALVEVAAEFGEVVVVAPDKPQSGQGHAITLSQPLRLNRARIFNPIEAWECTGTPVDCVKLAKHVVLKDRPLTLCLSGINHGSNASINIVYSGTMSAAMEGSLEGVNSIGFSLLDYSFDADFEPSKIFVRKIIAHTLTYGLGDCKLLNVNIPRRPLVDIRGIRICRQADARWKEEFVEGHDPQGRPYYWLTGKFVNDDPGEDTDVWALDQDFVSAVPSGHDLTRYAALAGLRGMEEQLASEKA